MFYVLYMLFYCNKKSRIIIVVAVVAAAIVVVVVVVVVFVVTISIVKFFCINCSSRLSQAASLQPPPLSRERSLYVGCFIRYR